MIHQLFIKLFILLAVIDFAVAGVLLGNDWLLYISLLNLVMMIVLLFQHRPALQKITPEGKRTLFTPSVFFLIAIWVGIMARYFMDLRFWELLHLRPIAGAIGVGLFTYVASYVLFRMGSQVHGWKGVSAFLFGLLFLGVLGWIGTLLGVVYGSGIINTMIRAGEKNIDMLANAVVEQDIPVAVSTGPIIVPKSDEVGENLDAVVVKPEFVEAEPEPTESEQQVDDNDTVLGQPEPSVEIPEEASVSINYAQFIPWIVDRYQLKAGNGAKFDRIATTSHLYSAFDAARTQGMIGTNINPDWFVKCQNGMVIVGIAEGWSINRSLGVLDGYRQQAQERGLTSICGDKTQVMKTGMLRVLSDR